MNKCPYLLCVFLMACSSSDSDSPQGETIMFLSKPAPSNYVISSPLEGVLTNNGRPLSNTRIIRELTWNGNDGELQKIKQEYLTGEDGKFSLLLHEEILALAPLEQFVGKTSIEVEYEGVTHELWYSAKMDKELNSEYDTPPAGVVCDISNPEIGVNMNLGMCLTRCRWDNMPEDNPDDL